MNKSAILICSSIILAIFCTALNFGNSLYGPMTVKNVIVTFVYIVCWIFLLIYGMKGSNNIYRIYFCMFWIITFGTSIAIAYLTVTLDSHGWLVPFVILIVGPWSGLDFFVANDHLAFSRIIAVISLIMAASGAILIKGKKSA